ncbi:MAG TPA: CusA/CzcA family heavy metal efflux RND transporter [Verrucomicrobia bacterium]|nr:MAG: metal transporter [Lentisphaerae bacterium GWF2_57_35]HBA83764.1 CusA/CzcA family heavy metal efflux RND transporter [Verrucomicrobiota bacterium]
MFDKLIRFVLHQRLLVILGTVILAGAGIFAWKTLPVDAFPDVTNVQVMILTEAPGLAPLDVEQQITTPIELAMQGLPGVTQVRSLSKAALSQVIIVLEDGVDIYFARQLLFQRLQTAKEQLPAWAEPEMGPISTGLGEIYQYTLESETHTPMELRTLQDWYIAPQLRAIPGINEVNSFGGFVKQYHVLVDQNRLLKYGITLSDVLEAIERNNANAGGNFLVRGWEQAYVRSLGLIQGIEDIENIVLEARDGAPVFLHDVAAVKLGPETRQGAVTRDGQGEAVAGMTIMLKDQNSKLVVEAVKKAIPKIQAGLPEGVRINAFYDRTALIQACIGTVGHALWQGGLLVVVVLFLFLGNLRAALIVALSLPLTAFIAFILMGSQGVTANLMSLGGLAIALGMIVDASIVVCENIARHLAEKTGHGLSRLEIIYEAVREVARPVVFAILIVVIVFLPLFSLQQMEGKMFRPLALTMCFAMVGSLLVSLTIVPVLSSFFMSGQKEGRDNAVVRLIKRGYLPVLALALRRPKTLIGLAGALLVGSLALTPWLGTEFLPQLDEGAIAINVVRLPSASLEGSVAVGTEIERRLIARFTEVRTVVTKTGRAEISEDPMGPEQNDVFIMLHPKAEWKTGRSKPELVAAIQTELAAIPGIRLSFSQPISLRVNELISGIKSDLAIKLFGPDLEVLRESANRVAALMQGIRGAEDVKVEQVSGFPQVEIVVDRKAIARHKINIADINEIVETAVGGKIASTVVEEQKRFAILVRFPVELRRDVFELERLLVPSPEGARIPLGELASIREVEAPAQVSRENGMRRVVVECNIRGRDMGSFVSEVREAIQPAVAAMPDGYFADYGGQFENQQRAMQRLSIVVPVSILLIFLMLFSTFGSMKSALLVLVNLPFALIGGILIMVVLKIPLSVSASIGFIALFGIAVENGTLLVSFFDQLRREGLSPEEAVRRGCELRLRPLLMTALTTLLGLLPLVWATGSGSEIQRPLAAVVLGGLASAMVLTLVVLPALYYGVEMRRDIKEAAIADKEVQR